MQDHPVRAGIFWYPGRDGKNLRDGGLGWPRVCGIGVEGREEKLWAVRKIFLPACGRKLEIKMSIYPARPFEVGLAGGLPAGSVMLRQREEGSGGCFGARTPCAVC